MSGTNIRENNAGMNILPTVTTISGMKWMDKIDEINRLELEEIAIFPTCLDAEKRKKLYGMLERSSVKRIPYVHLRCDMDIAEMEYLMRRFETKVFNIHTSREFPFQCDYSKYAGLIYVENIYYPLDEEEIKKFAGICVDFSHLENDRLLYKEKYEHNVSLIEKYKIGCNHLSAIKKETSHDDGSKYDRLNIRYDSHELGDLAEYDYLKNYPRRFFSDYLAIELENSIERQLEAKKYLEKLIIKLK